MWSVNRFQNEVSEEGVPNAHSVAEFMGEGDSMAVGSLPGYNDFS